MNSNRIFGLPDSPSADNDATSKKYVDTKTYDMATNASVNTATSNMTSYVNTKTYDMATNASVTTATANMATTSSVTTAITNALAIGSGPTVNNPSVSRNDTMSDTMYLTGMLGSDTPDDNVTRRGRLAVHGNLVYTPNKNTLYVPRINGVLYNSYSQSTVGNNPGFYGPDGWMMRIMTDTGNVGIGNTTVPVDTKLFIYDSGSGNGTRIRMESVYGNKFTIGTGHANSEAYVWNEANTDLGFATNNSRRMTIKADGNIGIGTTNATYPLHVASSTSNYIAPSSWYINFPVPNPAVIAGGNYTFSIHSAYGIQVGSYIVFYSDKRIKQNIKDIDGNTALSQIRQLRPKTYNYIDYRSGNGDVYGFIAQDVKDVILNSTVCSKNYIPNFYCRGNICAIDASNHIYEISSENDLSFDKVIDDSGNEILYHNVKIYGFDNNTEYICSVIHVNNPKNVQVKLEKEYKFANDEENKYKIFIYGQEIYDFYSLEKNAI